MWRESAVQCCRISFLARVGGLASNNTAVKGGEQYLQNSLTVLANHDQGNVCLIMHFHLRKWLVHNSISKVDLTYVALLEISNFIEIMNVNKDGRRWKVSYRGPLWTRPYRIRIFFNPQLTISFWIWFPRLHASVFKSNLLVHTYPTRFRINSVFKNFNSGGPIQKV